jgi:uncharacterized iron-regulated membrane protein
MKIFRKILFWLHLAAGVTAGIIVLLMSVTGVLLTYEKQMIMSADKSAYKIDPAEWNATPLKPEALIAKVSEAGAVPSGITIRADGAAPASVSFPNANGRGERSVFVHPYNGDMLGEGAQAPRHFFHVAEDLHRWIAMDGAGRPFGKAITGISNLLFLFMVISGLYLWFPRTLTFAQIKQVIWFKRGLPSKARDFNWHNVIGFWCCIPLFVVVLAGVVISYPWASNLVFRAAGETPPSGPPRPPGQAAPNVANPATTSTPVSFTGLDSLVQKASQQRSDWQSINFRLPKDTTAPIAFSIDGGNGGQPQNRDTLTLDRAGQTVKLERFSDGSKGRQWRTILRFAHTGEILGWFGQTLAGIASLGACFLVYTGIALSWRRMRAWQGRRARAEVSANA